METEPYPENLIFYNRNEGIDNVEYFSCFNDKH